MHTTGNFILHGGDTAFANRQKLLFDKLSDAEQECNKNKIVNEPMDMDSNIEQSNYFQILKAGRQSQTRRFRGKESIFKRPEGPAPRALNRSIPDFHKNPHKWKKYSLDDVSNDDMTEESNTRAALSFLKELKARRSLEKLKQSEKMDINESDLVNKSQMKIIFKSKKKKISTEIGFKKPENNTNNIDNIPIIIENNDKPVFKNSKLIMPEYVVGQKRKTKVKKEKCVAKVDRSKQLKLDHLEELDEEEN
ncbi:U5 small nuclear ribonucleoprotein TSSC4 isoform X1 [Apis cerana]|uniref:U5 small nuclear ribonucleoprotein TSSC4 isoform X1 n=2 Tax=Apis cerana TaxID=7461 RepID=UPI0007E2C3F7|nr:U5 small nuclear ribonucleoprotein TSSC4 isoform X1 [Apis cerana]